MLPMTSASFAAITHAYARTHARTHARTEAHTHRVTPGDDAVADDVSMVHDPVDVLVGGHDVFVESLEQLRVRAECDRVLWFGGLRLLVGVRCGI